MPKRVKRKVKTTDLTKRGRSSSIMDTLECGHLFFAKGSQGLASHRFCRECESLRDGAKVRIGDEFEKWDEETQMPYRVPVSSDPTYMGGE